MYAILIWNDLEGDFIFFKKDGKRVTTSSWAEANDIAAEVTGSTNQQTRVQFVRNTTRPKKTNRNGRVRRIQTVMFDGERVKLVGVINSKGEKVK